MKTLEAGDLFAKVVGDKIIASGSNSNGNYIKFSDGTAICYGTKNYTLTNSTQVGNIYYTDVVNLGSLPITYIALPIIHIASTGQLNVIEHNYSGNGSLGTCYFFNPTTRVNAPIALHYIAIGKWK